ncbi:MAG: amidophosphoribosyltransferase [Thermoproteota archaeon]|nr:amidophosphoribosyltransferase [Candidatus Brockarchaeota archaeon]
MTGILGIYLFDEKWNAGNFGVYGLMALQHRGQETAGIELLGKNRKKIAGEGLVEDVLNRVDAEGHICIGAVSPYPVEVKEEIPPFMLSDKVSVAIDGRVTGIENYTWENHLSYEENLRRAFEKYSKGNSSIEIVKEFFDICKGGFAYIAVNDKNEMVAGRSTLGVKPLSLGKFGFEGGIVASETCVMDVIGERVPISPAENVEPGWAMIFTPFSAKWVKRDSCKRAYCSFEYVYLARPDSYVNDIPIYRVRRNIGKKLAEEGRVDADVVIGVPETAIPFAMAYSNETGIPIEKGFELTGRRVRSALRPDQFERLKGVQLKLNVISEAVKGKRVVLIDDSVVRGNTLANIVYLMKEKGAKEIHVRIGSPHIISHCPFGVEVPPEDELIGRHLSEEKIAEVVGADSFKYLSINGLVEAIGLREEELCLGCFNCIYPEV